MDHAFVTVTTLAPGARIKKTETGFEVTEPDGTVRDFQIIIDGSDIVVHESIYRLSPDFSISVGSHKGPTEDG